MTAVFVVLATFVGSAFLVLSATFAVMLYEGKAAIPGSANARVLHEQGLARLELARSETARTRLLVMDLESRAYNKALGTGGDEV